MHPRAHQHQGSTRTLRTTFHAPQRLPEPSFPESSNHFQASVHHSHSHSHSHHFPNGAQTMDLARKCPTSGPPPTTPPAPHVSPQRRGPTGTGPGPNGPLTSLLGPPLLEDGTLYSPVNTLLTRNGSDSLRMARILPQRLHPIQAYFHQPMGRPHTSHTQGVPPLIRSRPRTP